MGMVFTFEDDAWPPLKPTEFRELIVQRVRSRYATTYPENNLRFEWAPEAPERLDVTTTNADGSEITTVAGRAHLA